MDTISVEYGEQTNLRGRATGLLFVWADRILPRHEPTTLSLAQFPEKNTRHIKRKVKMVKKHRIFIITATWRVVFHLVFRMAVIPIQSSHVC